MSVVLPNSNHRVATAARALREGRLSEAERLSRLALLEKPSRLRPRLIIGRVKFARWMASAAASQFAAAAGNDPELRSLLLLVAAERRRENPQAALAWARRAVQKAPDDLTAILSLAQCAMALDGYAETEPLLRRVADIDAGRADVQNGLGLALQGLGRHREAADCFERAAALVPAAPVFLVNLTEALLAANDVPASIAAARRLLDLRPDDPASYMLLSQALIADNLTCEADREAKKAAGLGPGDPMAVANLGSTLMAVGQMEEARTQSERAIALEPRQGIAYFNLVRTRRMTADDRPLVDQMKGVAEDPKLPSGQRCLLAFGLGKALEDLGEYEEAMARYDEANSIDYRRKFGEAPFDMELNRAIYQATKARYTHEFLAANAREADGEETPIFVFGMMRSGTTLTEQILSSHPEVGAAGEQRFWLQNRAAAFRSDGSLDDRALQELKAEYLAILRRISPGTRFVVDKMPTNTMHVGLLQLAFPNAPMVHIRRHPIDTCLSIYATQNRVPIPWANRKDQIALNYERYLDLMDHWTHVLPHGRMMELRYEELVSDPQLMIERLLDYCGLPWSDDCLHHENNERGVVTPSVWQVRQPIYKSSVARWKRFEPWLGGLANLKELCAA